MLADVVPVEGDGAPQQNALELTRFSAEEAMSPAVLAEIGGGQDVLLRQGLRHAGF